jgi:hypothetical protein
MTKGLLPCFAADLVQLKEVIDSHLESLHTSLQHSLMCDYGTNNGVDASRLQETLSSSVQSRFNVSQKAKGGIRGLLGL